MSRPSIGAAVAVEMLSDFEWHSYKKVRAKVMAAIPPGEALRRAEQVRIVHWNQENPGAPIPPRMKNKDTDRLILIGRKSLSNTILRNKVYEIDKENDRIRLRESYKYQNNQTGTHLKKAFRPPPEPRSLTAGQEQAFKAVATRRARGDDLSETAKRGWETRRKRAADARLQAERGRDGPGQSRGDQGHEAGGDGTGTPPERQDPPDQGGEA